MCLKRILLTAIIVSIVEHWRSKIKQLEQIEGCNLEFYKTKSILFRLLIQMKKPLNSCCLRVCFRSEDGS